MNDINKALASYALFRELYEKGFNDIYAILAEFVKDTILEEGKYSFCLDEIASLVNENYGFSIPSYVVEVAIRRICDIQFKRNRGMYIVEKVSSKRNERFEQYKQEVHETQEKILKDLYSYITDKVGHLLSAKEKQKILKAFFTILVDKNQDKGVSYGEYISAFIVNSEKTQYAIGLNKIREGVLIYTGINYSRNDTTYGWNKELTIYLDMEILFHLAGYNGEIYKEITLELLEMLEKIPNRRSQRLIKLQYFKETRQQIERFFEMAAIIVERNEVLNPENVAMAEIVDGCKGKADVVDKRSKFFLMLRQYGIMEDEKADYYYTEEYIYYMESASALDQYAVDEKDEETARRIQLITNIYKLRKGRVYKSYKECEYLLLTETKQTLEISREIAKEDESVPYAINIITLTNLLWNSCNKGFGAKDFPKSIDVIIKAKILLSEYINEKISDIYMDVKRRVENGEMSKEQILLSYDVFRENSRKPEDIEDSNVENSLIFITEEDFDTFQKVNREFREQAKRNERANVLLHNENDRLKKEKKRLDEIHQAINEHVQALQSKENICSANESKKITLESTISKREAMVTTLLVCGILLYYSLVIGTSIIIGWDKMTIVRRILELGPAVLAAVLILPFKKPVSLGDILSYLKKRATGRFIKERTSIQEEIEELKRVMNKEQEALRQLEEEKTALLFEKE